MILFFFTTVDLTEASIFLGMEDSHGIEHNKGKEKLKKEYLRTLRVILGTK
jgi:hypothetical protein